MPEKPTYEELEQRILELKQAESDRRRTEKALRESELLFSQMFQQSTTAICLYNSDGNIVKVNPEFCKMFGVEEKTIINARYNVFKDQATIDAGAVPLLREIFDEKKSKNWEIDFNIDVASESTGTPTSRAGKIFLKIFGYPVLNRKGDLEYVILQHYDITARKQSEEKLRESEERFRTTMEDLPAGLFAHDLDGRIVLVNEMSSRNTGYSRDELLNMSVSDIDPSSITRNDRVRLWHTLNNGKSTVIESKHTRKDGTEYPVEVRLNAVSFNKQPMILAIAFDITQREQAEKELHESEERYRNFFDNSLAGLFRSRLSDGMFVEMNSKAAEQMGLPVEEVVGKVRSADLYRNPDKRRELIAKLKQDGEVHDFEVDLTLHDGRDITCSISVKAYPDKDYMEGAVIDITERKQAEASLRESDILLNKVSSIAKIGGWEMDLEKGGRSTWTKGVYDIIEVGQEEPIPGVNEHVSWYLPEYREMIEIKMKDLIERKQPMHFEAMFKTIKGNLKWCQVIGEVVEENGKVVKIRGTFQDITDLKRVEEEKRKALEFAAEQSRHALIGQVAGKMAHDFNNVLMGIMGNAQLAIMNCDDEKTKGKLERINEFSERGRDITNNLMSFSKDQEPKQTYFKIEDKIELVLKMLEKDLTGIEVSRNYKPGIPELLADPGMIQDVLTNIIQNSIHAMSKVENPTLNLKAYSQDDKVYFEIEDNGCGIPKEHQGSIYTPSFTLKGSQDRTGSYKSEIKGTGYGMSNVKKYVVEKHKGDISLESEVGKGTRITIVLKIIKDQLSSDEKKEIVKSQIYDKRRILLVEDEAAIADVQYHILTEEPFRHIVSIAVNGQMAIDIFDRNKFDCVSLDYMLPGNINGLDIYNHIREKDRDIPVMFISGNIEFIESMKQLKEKDLNLEHLSKPVDNLCYVNKINELVGRSIKAKK